MMCYEEDFLADGSVMRDFSAALFEDGRDI